MTSFDEILKREFPGALSDIEYVKRTGALLRPLGFSADNAIACVATCRDELCRPVRELIHGEWGEAFNFSSLAGMLTLGRTGFHAFHAHAPRTSAPRQHVYYAMPHLGIDADGTLGVATRRGIPEGSKACGALLAFAAELAVGPVHLELDVGDIEQSLVKRRLVETMLSGWDALNPVELVSVAERAIRADLEAGIAATIDTSEVDYGLFTGIQIHGPDRCDYVHPVASYVVLEGERRELSIGRHEGRAGP